MLQFFTEHYKFAYEDNSARSIKHLNFRLLAKSFTVAGKRFQILTTRFPKNTFIIGIGHETLCWVARNRDRGGLIDPREG